jgi:acyl-homoserine lactone acylase PvdQ
MNLTQFIIPTGQSGQQNSPHYSDQADLYNKGLYRTSYMDEKFIRHSKEFTHLMLTPKK